MDQYILCVFVIPSMIELIAIFRRNILYFVVQTSTCGDIQEGLQICKSILKLSFIQYIGQYTHSQLQV